MIFSAEMTDWECFCRTDLKKICRACILQFLLFSSGSNGGPSCLVGVYIVHCALEVTHLPLLTSVVRVLV